MSRISTQIRSVWSQHQNAVLRAAIAVMTTYMVLKLGSEFYRLLFEESRIGAIDLGHRYVEVQRWFAHLPVYFDSKFATYPPMSYLFFWLALAWAPFGVCRWLWAGASLLALFWLSKLTVRASGASTRLERIFAALIPLSMTGTGVAIGNGQIIQFLVPVLATAILLAARNLELNWRSELAVILLMLVSLIHPTTAGPFFLLLLIVSPRMRPALLAALAYLVLSFVAASFQAEELPALINSWLGQVQTMAEPTGYAHVHHLLINLGWKHLMLPASMLVITGFGVWTFVHRRSDLWLLLGVTAIVARVWTYHGLYDDLLMIFPMISLFRIAKGAPHSNDDIKAGVLLGFNVLVMLMPGRMHYYWAPPWPEVFAWAHVAVWLPTLVFLLMQARGALIRQAGAQGLASAGRAVTLARPNGQSEAGP